METMQKIPVSEAALLARINRRLASSEEKICKTRADSKWFNDLGCFYVVNIRHNTVVCRQIEDLESWTREEYPDVLKPYEALTYPEN